MYQQQDLQYSKRSSSSTGESILDSYERYLVVSQHRDSSKYQQYFKIDNVRINNKRSQQQPSSSKSQQGTKIQMQKLSSYTCQNKADLYDNPYESFKKIIKRSIEFDQPNSFLLKYFGEIARVYSFFYGQKHDLIKKKLFGISCAPDRIDSKKINRFYDGHIKRYLENRQIFHQQIYRKNTKKQLESHICTNQIMKALLPNLFGRQSEDRAFEVENKMFKIIEQNWRKNMKYGDQWMFDVLRTVRKLSGWTGSTTGIKALVGNLNPDLGQIASIITYDRMYLIKPSYPYITNAIPTSQLPRISQSSIRNLVSLVKTVPIGNQDLIQLKINLYFSLVQKLTELNLQTGKTYPLLNPQIIVYQVADGRFGIRLEYLLVEGLRLKIEDKLELVNFVHNYGELESYQFRIFIIFLYIEQTFGKMDLSKIDHKMFNDGKWWAKQFFCIRQEDLHKQWQKMVKWERDSIEQLELITRLANQNCISKYLLLNSMFSDQNQSSHGLKFRLPQTLDFYHQQIHVASLAVSLPETISNLNVNHDDDNNVNCSTYPKVIVNAYVLHLRFRILHLMFKNITKLLNWLVQRLKQKNHPQIYLKTYQQIDRSYWVCYTMLMIASMELYLTEFQRQQNLRDHENNNDQDSIENLLIKMLIDKLKWSTLERKIQQKEYRRLYQYIWVTLKKLQYILITSGKIDISKSPKKGQIKIPSDSPEISFLYSKHLHNLLNYVSNSFSDSPLTSPQLGPLVNVNVFTQFGSQVQKIKQPFINSILPLLTLMPKLLLILHADNANTCDYRIFRKMATFMKQREANIKLRQKKLNKISSQIIKQQQIFNKMPDLHDVNNILWGILWKQHAKYENILQLD